MSARDKASKRAAARAAGKRRAEPPRPPGKGTPAKAPPGKRPPGGPSRLLIAAVALVVVGAAFMLLPRFLKKPPAPRADLGDLSIPTQALFDTVVADEKRHDWEVALKHAQQLVAREPRNAGLLLVLADELSNFAWNGASFERHRPPVRTSLERARIFGSYFTMLDSVVATFSDSAQLVAALRSRGQFYELMGMPIDGLTIYMDVLRRAPRDMETLNRRAWVINHLRSPLVPDDEWIRRRDAAVNAAKRELGKK